MREESDGQTDLEGDRQTDRQTQTSRQTETVTQIQRGAREGRTGRQRHRDKDSQRQTQTEAGRGREETDRPGGHTQTNGQTDRRATKQWVIHKRTDRQTGNQTDRYTDRQTQRKKRTILQHNRCSSVSAHFVPIFVPLVFRVSIVPDERLALTVAVAVAAAAAVAAVTTVDVSVAPFVVVVT